LRHFVGLVSSMEKWVSTNSGLFQNDPEKSIAAHRFAHQAMATIFEIICVHEDRGYAEQAAWAVFDMIDRLETALTCHRGGSDISRINRLRCGDATSVDPWTMDCLLLARHFHAETEGAFDISLGTGLDAVELTPADCRVRIHRSQVCLNLGGIGKGYALDRAAELMQEWEVSQALIHGGCSSVLALEPPPGHAGWPLTISLPGTASVLERFMAQREAWSASGIRKGDHIVDPRTGRPVRNRPGAWISGSLEALGAACRTQDSAPLPAELDIGSAPATAAEAFSTAFMILSCERIADCCRRHPGVEARVLLSDPSDPTAPPIVFKT
jgi:thiamine biosynthesis lipoprotein